MPFVQDLLNALELVAPSHLALPDDVIGLQVGRKSDQFKKCVVTLDTTPACIEFAVHNAASAIVSHHPVIFHPLKNLAGDSLQVQVLRKAMAGNINIIAAHTNWDTAPGGVNDTLAKSLNLQDIESFGEDIPSRAFKIVTFLPKENLDAVIDAMAAAGAGQIGLYTRCAFFGEGVGTYEPQDGARPTIGEVGKREQVAEYRLEMRLNEHARLPVEKALLDSHPYDEPAYDIFEVANSRAHSLPRLGRLPLEVPFGELASYVETALGSKAKSYGKLEKKIRMVGVVGGSGGRYWLSAKAAGCDALVTGEVKHSDAVEAGESGMCIIEAGHYHTEQPGMKTLAGELAKRIGEAQFLLYEPPEARSGRSA